MLNTLDPRLVLSLLLLLVVSCQREAASKPSTPPAKPAKGTPQVNTKKGPVSVAQRPASPGPPTAASEPARKGPNLGYDLRANLPLVHLYQGGVVADAGAGVGFVKYIRDMKRRWKLGVEEEGRVVAFPPGRQASLWLPVGPELSGKRLVVEALFKPIRQNRLGVFINNKQIPDAPELTGTWQRVRLPLPAGLIKAPGVARVRLYFGRARAHAGIRTCAAIRYVRLARADAPELPIAEQDLARALKRHEGDALVLPEGGGIDYYITPVQGLRLGATASSGQVTLSIQLDGKEPQQLAAGKSLDMSLDAAAGKAVRLMLRGRGGRAKLTSATLSGGRHDSALRPKKPRYVIFWLIDALRADKLTFYGTRGNDRPQVNTPHLAAVAKEGVVFDPFWVNSDESKASHASYWTGTYPVVHRVETRPAKLRDSHVTIAEAFREAGYHTAAYVSNGFISRRWNYVQGFQQVTNFIREGKPNDAKAVVEKAIPWIDRHKAGPFYLFLGTSDTHVTYRVHKQFIRQYDSGPPYRGPYRRFISGHSLGKIKMRRRPPPKRERERIEAIYENEAAFNDLHFGRLVAHLKKLGILGETLLIINSDHGEEFWEHGSCGHGNSLHQELISVPFVLRWPGVLPAGRVTSGHDGVDLIATLFDLLGQNLPEEVQGESLLPFIAAKTVYPRAMVASRFGGSYALRAGPAKVIMGSAESIKSYDLSNDPTEHKNLYRTHPVLTLAALDPLSLFIARPKTWRKSVWGVPNNLTRAFH